jgi:hypothetical protein
VFGVKKGSGLYYEPQRDLPWVTNVYKEHILEGDLLNWWWRKSPPDVQVHEDGHSSAAAPRTVMEGVSLCS